MPRVPALLLVAPLTLVSGRYYALYARYVADATAGTAPQQLP